MAGAGGYGELRNGAIAVKDGRIAWLGAANDAAAAGSAAAVLAPEDVADQSAPVIRTKDIRRAYSLAAARFWGRQPAICVAITGTNGKTSTVEMTRQLWRMAGFHAASIGTLGITTSNDSASTGLTTPDIVTFLSNMSGLATEGVSHAAFEASSHGLDQYRTEGLPVKAAAFTNLGAFPLPNGSKDAALVIDPARATLPSVLKRAGYTAAAVGKWHLGLGLPDVPLDWNRPLAPGPREVGFDYSFIMAATADRVPCVYVEDQRVVGLDPRDPLRVDYKTPFPGEPTGVSDRAQLKQDWSHGHNMAVVNGIGRIGYSTGGRAAQWVDEDMADTFTARAVAFIAREKDRPFFLYFAPHDIHVPRVPHPRFVGKT
eukprot:gene31783-39264_t